VLGMERVYRVSSRAYRVDVEKTFKRQETHIEGYSQRPSPPRVRTSRKDLT